MTWLLLAHLGAALLGPFLVRAMGRDAFYLLALAPAATALWTLSQDPHALASDPLIGSVPWIPAFGVELSWRLDVLSWVLLLIVSGIGTLVLAYCARYFKDTEPGLGRFAAVLTAFAGAMVGLVVADDVVVLYTFWELTTIFSFLLIGHYSDKQASRRAAMNALLSTTAGGLAMLAGLLMLASRAGTMSLAGIVASPMWSDGGPFLLTALLLVLAGATSKSALVPTHFWLPGAMAAPTPVSAYLHAAAMVKAGIYLILRLGPVIALAPAASWIVAVLGAATMLVGGWRALRQWDIKLLLAYGTVSQLGFMAAIAAIGTRGAALAALALLIAHSLFKAPLFMVVGAIDKKFGSRDLRCLNRTWRQAPVLAVIGVLSAASMAGLSPLLGFVTKEAVLTALWEGGAGHRALALALVAGSILTVAYAWRFVVGAFGPGSAEPPAARPRITPGFWGPPALIALGTLALPLLAGPLETLLHGYADTVPDDGAVVHLALVPHVGIPLLLSGIAIAGGALLALGARPMAALQHAVSPQTRGGALEEWLDAEKSFRRLLRVTDRAAVAVTGLVQRGSLPYTLGTMFVVLIVLMVPVAARIGALPDNLVPFFSPAEVGILVIAVLGSIGAARSRRRLRAIMLVTVTGFCSALLFLMWGAPDVATTQVLVETILTVVMVLVLRRLPLHFSRRPLKSDQWLRWSIAIGTAVVLCSVALVAAGARVDEPFGPGLIETAYTIGGGHNVVNVALVDARVWDTMGEISVLLVVATGVASLIFVTRLEQRIARVKDIERPQPVWRRPDAAALPENVLAFDVRPSSAEGNRWRTWLSAGLTLAPERRMVILEVITRLVFPLMMLFSIYLLMAGHNDPGGGFAGGLVAGLALTLRYLAGGRYELSEAAPVQAGLVLGTGMGIAVLTGLVPVALGGGVFDSYVATVHLPVLGEKHVASALVFDVGVYLVVIGVVLDFLRSLGSQIDRQQEAELDAR